MGVFIVGYYSEFRKTNDSPLPRPLSTLPPTQSVAMVAVKDLFQFLPRGRDLQPLQTAAGDRVSVSPSTVVEFNVRIIDMLTTELCQYCEYNALQTGFRRTTSVLRVVRFLCLICSMPNRESFLVGGTNAPTKHTMAKKKRVIEHHS